MHKLTDFELRQIRETASLELQRNFGRAKREYWHHQYRKADDELRDRTWNRIYSLAQGEEV